MRPIASLWAQCHVVSNIDLFLENTLHPKKPPRLAASGDGCAAVKTKCFSLFIRCPYVVHKHPIK